MPLPLISLKMHQIDIFNSRRVVNIVEKILGRSPVGSVITYQYLTKLKFSVRKHRLNAALEQVKPVMDHQH